MVELPSLPWPLVLSLLVPWLLLLLGGGILPNEGTRRSFMKKKANRDPQRNTGNPALSIQRLKASTSTTPSSRGGVIPRTFNKGTSPNFPNAAGQSHLFLGAVPAGHYF